MRSFTYVIKDKIGLHARIAGMLVKIVKETGGCVTLEKDGKVVDASKLNAIMALGVKCGDAILISVDDDEIFYVIEQFLYVNL